MFSKNALRLVVITLAFSFSNKVSAQGIYHGDIVSNMTLGFGNININSERNIEFPAISLSLEYCFLDDVLDEDASLTAGFIYGRSDYTDNNSIQGIPASSNYGKRIFAVQPAFYYELLSDVDFYSKLRVGYKDIDHRDDVSNFDIAVEESGFYMGFVTGARYSFNDQWAGIAEIGVGVGLFNIGVSYNSAGLF